MDVETAMSRHENEVDTTDEALGTTVMLRHDDASLSTKIIMDYFTHDGLRCREIDSTNKNAFDETESTGDKQTRRQVEEIAIQPFQVQEIEKKAIEDITTKYQEEMRILSIAQMALTVLVVIVALAQCVWMWQVVELSALSLAVFGD
ncbi:unnamed protein product [Peronospora belbahrii]|uniref:Uncharacterized protein n=1 Tax=Peronospora belbahrii TaxID=622444 RepID=A0AAU9KMP7_9STRA|nr:unnamed protein product [Peronospora belbahrii]CAH0515173.1 unnamed protein product [Peronospora belbahrii]